MFKNFLVVSFLGLSNLANAQVAVVSTQASDDVLIYTIMGVITSLAISYFLLKVGVASGASAVYGAMISSSKGNSKSKHKDKLEKTRLHEKAKKLGKRINAGIHLGGILNCLLVSVSLFLGAYFASEWLVPFTWARAIAFGLFIWAGYSILIKFIQTKIFKELVKPVVNLGGNSYSSGQKTLKNFLSNSARNDRKYVKKMTKEIIKEVKNEMGDTYKKSKLADQFDDLLKEVKNQKNTSRQVLTNLAEVLNHTQIRLVPVSGSNEEKVIVHTDMKEVNFEGHNTKKVKGLAKRAIDKSKDHESRENKFLAAATVLSPGSEEQVEKTFGKINQLLKESNSEEFNPEVLKDDFKKIIEDPSNAKKIFKRKLDEVNVDDIIDSIEDKTNIDRSKIEGNLAAVKNYFTKDSDNFSKQYNTGEIRYEGATVGLIERDLLKGTFMDSDVIDEDIDKITDNPKLALSIVRERWNDTSKEDIKNILRAKTSLNDKQIDRYIKKYNKLSSRLSSTKFGALATIKDAKLSVKILSKDVVKGSISSVWWRVATSASGMAASVGGVAVATI